MTVYAGATPKSPSKLQHDRDSWGKHSIPLKINMTYTVTTLASFSIAAVLCVCVRGVVDSKNVGSIASWPQKLSSRTKRAGHVDVSVIKTGVQQTPFWNVSS